MKKLFALLVLVAVSVGCVTAVVVDEEVVKAVKHVCVCTKCVCGPDCKCTKCVHCKDVKCLVVKVGTCCNK